MVLDFSVDIIGNIMRDKHLNRFYFIPIFCERIRGLNNIEISVKLGISKNTVNKYVESLRDFSDYELSAVLMCLLNGHFQVPDDCRSRWKL